MCTGTIYRMTRCGHFIVGHTSKCRRYEITNPLQKAGERKVIPEPPGEPCPELHSGNNNKPVSVVSIEDSCASCMPRAQQWAITYGNRWVAEEMGKCVDEFLANGDRLAAASLRDRVMKVDQCAQEQLTTIDWSIIPAPEPVYPPSWTVEDDRGLSAAWIGYRLVWGNQESLREQRQLYEEEVKRRREQEEIKRWRTQEEAERRRKQEGDEEEDESENDDKETNRDGQRISKDNKRPRDAGTNNNEEPPKGGSSVMGYLFSEDLVSDDQDQPSGKDSRSAHSHRHHPQLRKQKDREALGEAEFFSFSNLDEDDDGRDDSYHIDDQNDDDDVDDIWMRISSEQPRDSRTAMNGSFPDHPRRSSQRTPDVARANRNKRLLTQAVRGIGTRYDLKPFIPSQHQQR